jgi:endonuclease III
MTDDDRVDRLLDRYGETFAHQAGIRLADRPGPLYQLLVLVKLLSTRISANVAVAGARELFAAGLTSPKAMRDASAHDRWHTLARANYVRYAGRAEAQLAEGAEQVLDRWGGDLRRMHQDADGDVARLRASLTAFPGIGPTGADIYLREVQAVWPDLRPYLDERVTSAAKAARLPSTKAKLAALVPPDRLPALAAALIRGSHDRELTNKT